MSFTERPQRRNSKATTTTLWDALSWRKGLSSLLLFMFEFCCSLCFLIFQFFKNNFFFLFFLFVFLFCFVYQCHRSAGTARWWAVATVPPNAKAKRSLFSPFQGLKFSPNERSVTKIVSIIMKLTLFFCRRKKN